MMDEIWKMFGAEPPEPPTLLLIGVVCLVAGLGIFFGSLAMYFGL